MSTKNEYKILNQENLEHALEYAKQAILSKKRFVTLGGNDYMMWPLFFKEDNATPEAEIDICTSSLGIIACSQFQTPDGAVSQSIQKGLSLLLYMRNEDGSWPSHISLVGKENLAMEGVINDTYFALNALMQVEFLSNSPKVSPITDPKNNNHSLASFSERLDIVCKSVHWLLDNKVNQGWQYTGTTYLQGTSNQAELKAYTLPSAHVIVVLSKVMDAIKIQDPNNELIDKIQSSIDDTVSWFCDICNRDGGFGITWSGDSRISNTAKVLLALSCTDYSDRLKERVEKTIHRAAKWLCLHYKPGRLRSNDVCEEFSQIIIQDNGTKRQPLKRSVIHETFVEPVIIEALISYWKKYRDSRVSNVLFRRKRIINTICVATEYMLGLQAQDGTMLGFVSSRRAFDNERYTMYSCCDFICALTALINSGIGRTIEQMKYVNTLVLIILIVAILSIAIMASMFSPVKPMLVAIISAISVALGPIIKDIVTSLIVSRLEGVLGDDSNP